MGVDSVTSWPTMGIAGISVAFVTVAGWLSVGITMMDSKQQHTKTEYRVFCWWNCCCRQARIGVPSGGGSEFRGLCGISPLPKSTYVRTKQLARPSMSEGHGTRHHAIKSQSTRRRGCPSPHFTLLHTDPLLSLKYSLVPLKFRGCPIAFSRNFLRVSELYWKGDTPFIHWKFPFYRQGDNDTTCYFNLGERNLSHE